MNNIENEQILNSAYKKALEQKAEWIFKIQSTKNPTFHFCFSFFH